MVRFSVMSSRIYSLRSRSGIESTTMQAVPAQAVAEGTRLSVSSSQSYVLRHRSGVSLRALFEREEEGT